MNKSKGSWQTKQNNLRPRQSGGGSSKDTSSSRSTIDTPSSAAWLFTTDTAGEIDFDIASAPSAAKGYQSRYCFPNGNWILNEPSGLDYSIVESVTIDPDVVITSQIRWLDANNNPISNWSSSKTVTLNPS